jgi:esterase/lipase superfamily enzyme
MDYVFTSRGIVRGAFGSDPGPTRFLTVPANAADTRPGHGITRRAFFDRIVAEAGPTGDVLIYVHGFNTDPATMLVRHRLIRAGLQADGYRGVVVSYDWPAASSALNYLEDRTDAKITALRLVTDGIAPFARFVTQDCRISVHVLAHSMGAFVLREAFDDADDRPAVAAAGWTLSQVMIAAGDVSADSMGITATSSSLYRHAVRLTNYSNPYDAVLSISGVKRVGVSPRVGRIGLPDVVPAKAVNVDCGDHYDSRRADFAGIANADHSWWFSDRTFLRDVHYTLKGALDRDVIPTRVKVNGKLELRA